MPRKSSLTKLPREIQDAVNKALLEGASIDDCVAVIAEAGSWASRSAVGRYAKNYDAVISKLRRAREIAGAVQSQVQDQPDGAARVLRELLEAGALQAVIENDSFDAEHGQLIAKMMKDLSAATKADAEVRAKIRAELKAEQAEAARAAEEKLKDVERAAAPTGGGVSAEHIAALRAAITHVMA